MARRTTKCGKASCTGESANLTAGDCRAWVSFAKDPRFSSALLAECPAAQEVWDKHHPGGGATANIAVTQTELDEQPLGQQIYVNVMQ